MDNISYYSMDEDLNTVENGIVTKQQAMDIIDKYILAQDIPTETGEQAVANSMFGFSINSDTFIELALDTRDEFRIKFETPETKKLAFIKIPGLFQKEKFTQDKEELKRIAAEFFDLSHDEFKDYFKSL